MTEVAERPAPAPPSQHRGLRGNPALTLAAISLGVMMVALDGTVVSVANPTIQRDLGATLAGLQWVTNGYLLALAVLLIPGGKLGDRFGRRRMFAIGIAGFALASLGCALSSSIGVLVCFRVLQGVSGAMLMPNTLAILKGAPHSRAAEALADDLLSPEVEATLAVGPGAQVPLLKGTQASARVETPGTLHAMEADFEAAARLWDQVAGFLADEFAGG